MSQAPRGYKYDLIEARRAYLSGLAHPDGSDPAAPPRQRTWQAFQRFEPGCPITRQLATNMDVPPEPGDLVYVRGEELYNTETQTRHAGRCVINLMCPIAAEYGHSCQWRAYGGCRHEQPPLVVPTAYEACLSEVHTLSGLEPYTTCDGVGVIGVDYPVGGGVGWRWLVHMPRGHPMFKNRCHTLDHLIDHLALHVKIDAGKPEENRARALSLFLVENVRGAKQCTLYHPSPRHWWQVPALVQDLPVMLSAERHAATGLVAPNSTEHLDCHRRL